MTTGQKNLFDSVAPWDDDDAVAYRAARVVFVEGAKGEFDYRVPDRLAAQVEPGRRLRVPFGRSDRMLIGYCVLVEDREGDPKRLKEVAAVIDKQPLLSPAMLRLAHWMSEYYLCPLGQVLESILPTGVRFEAGTRMATLLSVPDDVTARLRELDLPRKQQDALEYLASSPVPLTPQQLALAVRCTIAPIDALREKGLVHEQRARVTRSQLAEEPVAREANLSLNLHQQQVLDAILGAVKHDKHETFLLFGVTGSGKTEVYMQAIQEVVSYGRQAIVLVPEISLTPQTVARFRSRFDQVSVLHSHLSDAERHHHWQRISRGEVQVVVGARSAIFAPTPRLGLVVLDEEHESSFKQDTAPRYHARDVALFRTRCEGVPLVLGSATPSMESWHQASSSEATLLRLPKRVFDRPMPTVGVIDLRDEFRSRAARGALSRKLRVAMLEALEDDGQIILLLNRRGFSTHIQCPGCGFVVRCPSCDIALTYHRQHEIALCHYCEHQEPAPRRCPNCDFLGIHYGGLGTQRLEAEVRAAFPDYACARMDSDSMQRPGSYDRVLSAFREGTVRILLGTQMIAKGLDFPNVTLVGVINADTALQLPDFRASERTFQLLAQVAGRTGRGDKVGRVLVQTFSPQHPAILAAVHHDVEAFASSELPAREALHYPPFGRMARIIIRGPREEQVREFADYLGKLWRAALAESPSARVLGPVACPLAKLRDNFRYHLQAQATSDEPLRLAYRAITENPHQPLKPPEDVAWVIDVDPINMM